MGKEFTIRRQIGFRPYPAAPVSSVEQYLQVHSEWTDKGVLHGTPRGKQGACYLKYGSAGEQGPSCISHFRLLRSDSHNWTKLPAARSGDHSSEMVL